jgi:hypothetical protein
MIHRNDKALSSSTLINFLFNRYGGSGYGLKESGDVLKIRNPFLRMGFMGIQQTGYQ